MLYGKKKYEEDFNYIMKRYEDNLNDKSWIEHLLNAVKNNNIKNKLYSTLGVISWDANVFFVNATKSYLIDKDIESYKRNMYVGSKLSIMGEDSRNFLVYDRRTMFRILASNNQDLIHFIKKYPEPFEFINKFDLKTIIPEKWKEWIYEYCKNKEELLEDEKAGYFIQTITVEENSNLSIDKAENIAAIIGTTDNGKISPKAPNTSAIYDKVDKEQITRATAINTEISLKGKEISAEELGFKAGFEYKISAFWIGVGGGIDIDKNQGEFYHDEGIEDSGVKFMINAGYDYVYKIENPNKTVKQAIRDFVSDPEKTSENLKTMKIIYDLIKKYEGVKNGKNNKQQSTTKKIYIWCNYSHYTRIYYFIHNLKFENYFRYFYRIYIILFSNVYHYIF